ncbi:VWA domain-containing protein [Alkalimonas collagenimarina]|uniref:VWA domain-containing protein n=1 Tax=Alkalimonas collagenimarina TaxID=400390 RepID=A0ABT9GZB1_9GAMM|nr:VWA domain-containing protein [Alkalimonas collagenimarina]MDP4536405.1 VWA domain-containing protein [Alkalimonas collagenimarina]
MLAELHWIRPYWLLALLPVLLIWLLLLKYRKPQSPWQRFIAPHLQLHLLGQHSKNQPRWPLWLLAWCWVVATIAMAGPSWQRVEQPAIYVDKATVLIIDMSMSMYATDMNPNRLTQARFKALDYIDALQEGELALIAFAGDSFVVSPLTPDHNNVRLQLPTLRPDIMPSQGSNLYAALQAADQLLQQGGYSRGDIVALVDGFERHTERQLTDLVNKLPHRLSIIAFGSEEGAPAQLPDGSLLQDSRGSIVLPRVPLTQLTHLARSSGGVFQQADLSGRDIEAIINQSELSASAKLQQQLQSAGDAWRDKAIYLVWLLLPLALWLGKRGQLFVICLIFLPHDSFAKEFNWWQTPQQQAIEAYQQGDYQRAQQKFTDLQWQAQAAYRAGDYQTAEQAWRTLSEQTPSAEIDYNLGNALAQQGRYDEALAAYQQALQQQPDFKQAQHNAELMQHLLEQQSQEQDDGAEQGDRQDRDDPQESDQQSSPQDESSSGDDASDGNSAENDADPQPDTKSGDEQDDASDDATEGNEEPQENDADQDSQQQEPAVAEQGQQQIIESPWPDASPEEEQELMNILRKVQDDPALLLRNRMHIEHQRRRQHQLPTGVEEEW